ncbi:MAG: U32 family peptidase, partial [Candidatus Aenigmarchaeota archaeon]|nr:U32 family peptidase [Candidatus Aenigmarchaeota archaeon]
MKGVFLKRDKIELLSPAGSFDALVAAVQNGADAVYLGGREFNARINADNFSLPEMKKAIDYCHIRGVRVYAAVNTLVPDDRFSDALEYVRKAYLLGIDAVIVQDVGLASALMRIFPDLPIHASTQMTVHNSDGACLLKDMGFERMILSREVSLENIRRIKEKAKVILECFCHGAICISYSGQCLMSSFMFGRSGNRGVCAQPCRLKYSLAKGPSEVSKQSYMLSPRDLCTIKAVDKIGEAGVDTIKIEGRMRSPEYVACVTDAYRDGIDKGFVDAEKISGLSKVFNRGFCGGFVLGDTRGFINDVRQNNQGLYIGCCRSYDKKTKLMRMRLEEDLCVGDGLRIDSGDDEIGCKVKSIAIGKNIVKEAGKGDVVSLKVDKIVAESSPIYKTFDKKADAWAKGTYLKGKEIRKVPVDIKVRLKEGEKLSLDVSDGVNSVCSESSVSAEKAVKHAMTYEKLKEQFSRLGNTPFSIRKFVFDVDEGLMIPLSEIGRVRKEAVRKLEEMRSSVSRRMDDKTFTDMASKTMAVSRRKAKIKRTKISVHVGHMDV